MMHPNRGPGDGAGGEPVDPAAVLADCRQRIDRIDAVVVALLRERVRTAVEAADAKRALGEPLRAPAREAAVMARLASLVAAPLDVEGVSRIFRVIIEETLAVEELRPRDAGAQPDHRGAA